MFLIGNKELDIIEKERNSIVTPRVHLRDATNPNNGRLKFSALKLNIAIARCILSKDLTNLDLLFESVSSFFRYQTIINTKNRILTLNKVNFELLRDFSQKTRIGELAQGITYLFSQEHLKTPIVVDFEGFVRHKNYNAVINGETPDFILQKEANFNYSIIESKGCYASNNNSTKGKLKKALDQCDNGKNIIDIALPSYSLTKSYGVCIKLHNEQDSNTSEIQFVDPEFNNENKNFNLEIIRYHYASWFLLMGNLRIYEKLLGQELLDYKDLENSYSVNIDNNSFVMFDLFPNRIEFPFIDFWFYLHNMNRIRTYGIRKDVLNVLMGKSKKLPILKFKDNNGYYEREYELFADGTIINDTQQ